MRCGRCGGEGENVSAPEDLGPVWAHAELGAHWETGRHAFDPGPRTPAVVATDRGFQCLIAGRWYWPWEAPSP